MSNLPSADPAALPHKHRFYEDVLALLMGTLLAALGVAFYTEATLAVGHARVVERWTGTYASGPEPMVMDAPEERVRLVLVTSGTGASTSFAIAEETMADLYD